MSLSLIKSARELPEYVQVFGNLVARDLKVKYQSKGLGFAWSLLHPAILLGIWYVVFHRAGLLRDTMPRYWAYLLSGMLTFQFIQAGIVDGACAIRSNAGIIRKVYMPLEILVIAAVTVRLIEYVLQLLVALALLIAMHHGDAASISLIKSAVVLPGAILLVYLFVLGVSLPLAAWTVVYRDLDHIISLAMTAMFYVTPVFWAIPMLAGKKYIWLVALNPVADLLELFHSPLYWGRWPENIAVGYGALGAWAVPIAIVAVVFIIGYELFDKSKRILAEVV
jgi:lipopolysaccharide transport system permease protein